MPSKQKNLLIIVVAFLVFIVCVLASVSLYLGYKLSQDDKNSDNDNDQDTSSINSFEECEEAGYPIMESYPRQCAVPGGNTYTEVLDGDENGDNDANNEEGTTDEEVADTDTSDSTTKTIKVYFPRDPESLDDFDRVYSVSRTTTRIDVGTFALEQLTAGPTAAEQATGLFDVLDFTGTSNCSGKDLSLTVNKTTKVATLKFCKTAEVSGLGDSARITVSVEQTLKQFSTVDTVVILDKNGHCFGDESGMDVCLD